MGSYCGDYREYFLCYNVEFQVIYFMFCLWIILCNSGMEIDVNLVYIDFHTTATLVCFTSLMASLIRSVGGLSKCFYQGL